MEKILCNLLSAFDYEQNFPNLNKVMMQHYSNKLCKRAALRCTRLRPCLDAFHHVAKYQRQCLAAMERLIEKGGPKVQHQGRGYACHSST